MIPGCCPAIRDVVQRSGIIEKVDNFTADSVDNFDRNGWTTSNGLGGQHRPAHAERQTHLLKIKASIVGYLINIGFDFAREEPKTILKNPMKPKVATDLTN